MTRIKGILAAAIAAFCLVGAIYPARAQSLSQNAVDRFTGFYAGAALSFNHSDTGGVWDNADAAGPFPLNNLERTGFGGEVFVGYLFQAANGYVFGPELGLAKRDIGGNYTTSEPPGRGPDSWDFSADHMISARVRGGVLSGDYFIYGALGYTQMDYSLTLTESFSSSVTRSGHSAEGVSFAAGFEKATQGRMRIRGEVGYTVFNDSVDLSGRPDGDAGDRFTLDHMGSVSLGVVWGF